MINPRKAITLLLGGLIVLTGIILALNYFATTHNVKVTYSDVSLITITKRVGGGDQSVATVGPSGSSVRLPNDTDYTVHYTATNGYASGTQSLGKDAPDVTITPEYSLEKNTELMKQALPIARTLITQKYPQADKLYTLTSAGMRDRGKWYLVKLTYDGDYDYNTDTLKILLEKNHDTWQIVTKPDIIFTQPAYPSLPIDVLSWAETL